MRKSSPNAAAIEIEDAMVLTTGEDHTTAEGITALRADQAGLQQQLQGIAEVAEMGAQFSARGIADAQFFDHGGLAENPRSAVGHRFGVAGEVEVTEGQGGVAAVGGGRELVAQGGECEAGGGLWSLLEGKKQIT